MWLPLARAEHRLGFRLDNRLFQLLRGHTATRPRPGFTLGALLVLSAMMFALCVGLIGGGIWFGYTFPGVGYFIAVVLIALGVGIRPRLGSEREALRHTNRLTEADTPELFALIRRTAEVIGAPMPDAVAVAPMFNAYSAVVGLRRRRVLIIGLPLWQSLRPQERVALLGHELGHFVNGDSTRGLLTQPALTAIGRLADMLRPNAAWINGGIAAVVFGPPMALLCYLMWLVHLGVNAVGARESKRAEYYADDLAAQAAGTSAAASMHEVMLCGDEIIGSVRRWAWTNENAIDWTGFAEHARTANTVELARLGQLSRRTDASIFASHPPAGLRQRMLTEAPHRAGAIALTEAEAELIEAELLKRTNQYRSLVAGLA